MAQFFTDFSGYSTGAFPSDWTARYNADESWYQVESASSQTGGQILSIDVDENGSGHIPISWDVADGAEDVEIVALVRVLDDDGRRGCFCRGSGSAGNESYYVGDLQTVDHFILDYTNGSISVLSDASHGVTLESWHWIRFRANGSTLQLRDWDDESSEPGSWELSTSDSTHTSGFAGFNVNAGGATDQPTLEVDVVGVGTEGDSAPTEPVSTGPPAQPTGLNATVL